MRETTILILIALSLGLAVADEPEGRAYSGIAITHYADEGFEVQEVIENGTSIYMVGGGSAQAVIRRSLQLPAPMVSIRTEGGLTTLLLTVDTDDPIDPCLYCASFEDSYKDWEVRMCVDGGIGICTECYIRPECMVETLEVLRTGPGGEEM